MLTFRSTLLFVSAMALLQSAAQAFVMNAFAAHPSLQDLAQAQTNCKLSISCDIGKKPKNRNAEPPPHFFLDGLELELLQEQVTSPMELPGASGPHPQTSSGPRAIGVTQNPSFIGMNGKETVELENAGWEMVWRETGRAGTICCGLDVSEAVTRDNGATLPAGRIYMSFPIWTPELLAGHQATKVEVEKRASDFKKEKLEKLNAMQETDNFLMKAMLYRDAAAAAEKQDLTGAQSFQSIPGPNEVIQIQKGLLMGLKGTIWKKNTDVFGVGMVALGEAIVRPPKVDRDTLLRP